VFELLSNLRLQLAVVSAAVLIVALVLQRWWVATAAAVVVTANVAVMAPLLVPSPAAAPAPEAETLQIAFLNTKIRGADRTEVIDHLRDTQDDLDLVVLAATTSSWFRDIQEADLDLQIVTGPGLDGDLELLTLVRTPQDVEVEVHRPSTHGTHSPIVVELDGEPVNVLATHAVSPMTPYRAARRDDTFVWIADLVRQRDTPIVVLGDLNATSFSPRFRRPVVRTALFRPRHRTGGIRGRPLPEPAATNGDGATSAGPPP
jgi:endonuclease/exonuclease/phosphatase (EEP) superfamily protein YafD